MVSDVPTVTLRGTQVNTTIIGFGCSNLLGNKTRQQGLRLLETAFDAGIRHFDVAPYYGFGEAEAVVGEFARDKRDKITITTKFGLEPSARLARAKGLISIARSLMRAFPIVRKILRRSLPAASQGGLFDVAAAQRSLERSRLLLQTELIDIFLMHEPVLQNCQPDLLDFLQGAATRGQIRGFGVGAVVPQVDAIARQAPAFAPIIQFKSTVETREVERFAADAATRAMITHGAFTALPALRSAIGKSDVLARRWDALVAIDIADDAAVGGLLLQHAARMNPHGIVLFSSERPERIAANVRAVVEGRYEPQQLDGLQKFASESLGG